MTHSNLRNIPNLPHTCVFEWFQLVCEVSSSAWDYMSECVQVSEWEWVCMSESECENERH